MALPKIKCGLVGLHYGMRLFSTPGLRGDALDYVQIDAICDLDAAALDAAGKVFTTATKHPTLDGLLEEEKLEAVILMTGPAGRAGFIRKIINCGKDVITTKPFELNAAAAHSVLLEAVELERIVHLNSPSAVLPRDLAMIDQYREEYGLGEPIGGHFTTWCSYHEEADGSWYDSPERCPAAPVLRLGIYAIHDLIYLFGKPRGVAVAHSRMRTGRPTPDNGLLTIQFESGALASVYASFCSEPQYGYPDSLLVNYEHGSISRNLGLPHAGVKNRDAYLSVQVADGSHPATTIIPAAQRSGAYPWSAFQLSIRHRKYPDLNYYRQIVQGIEVVEAMGRAQGRSLEPVRDGVEQPQFCSALN